MDTSTSIRSVSSGALPRASISILRLTAPSTDVYPSDPRTSRDS